MLIATFSCSDGNNLIINSADYKVLLNAESFSDGGTGVSGTPTAETVAFKHIFFSENAGKTFDLLLANANFEGKLYALCGLYFYDFQKYKTYMEKYLNFNDRVTYFAGCLQEEIKISELIKDNDKDVVRLISNSQTIEAWINENNAHNGYSVDFYGGAIPQSLKEYISSDDQRIKLK
jgi:hypothetical protein